MAGDDTASTDGDDRPAGEGAVAPVPPVPPVLTAPPVFPASVTSRPPWISRPLSPGVLALAILAALVVVPGYVAVLVLSAGQGPLDLLEDPVRALAAVNEADRRLSGALPGPVAWVALGATSDLRRDAGRDWDELILDLTLHWPEEVEAAIVVRDVVLGAWGDDNALARLRAEHQPDPDILPAEVQLTARRLRAGAAPPAGTGGAPVAAALGATAFGVTIMAALLLVIWLARRRPAVTLSPEQSVGRFRLGAGLAVFAWCELIVLLVLAALIGVSALPGPGPMLSDALFAGMTMFQAIPMFALIWLLLLRPQGITLPRAMGLGGAVGGTRRLAVVVVVVLGIDWSVAMAVDAAVNGLGHSFPWYMAIDETLLFGSAPLAWLSAFDAVVGAPVLEEVLFRGVLFTALRGRIGVMWAALASGALFGAVHGYDSTGLLVVSFSGFLYALTYARTGSLLPCILVHSLSNGAVMLIHLARRLAL